jgi:hypothetical protein
MLDYLSGCAAWSWIKVATLIGTLSPAVADGA